LRTKIKESSGVETIWLRWWNTYLEVRWTRLNLLVPWCQ